MKTTSIFQYALLGFFGLVILVAVLLFAGVVPGTGPSGGAEVTIWGPFPKQDFDEIVAQFNLDYKNIAIINYEEKTAPTFESTLVEALASGNGPDLVIFPHELLYRTKNKLLLLSYKQLSKRTFLDTFVDGGSLFLDEDGIFALPLVIDPLVLYWNKNLIQGAGLARPPQYWEQVLGLAEKLTTKDKKGNITQSAIALGGYGNVTHAKEILSTLFFQVGDWITSTDGHATLGDAPVGRQSPTESSLRFYSEFGDPARLSYSWNTALPESRRAFESGNLALYLGLASEHEGLIASNPHLLFDVALAPQLKKTVELDAKKSTYGKIYGIGVLKNSPAVFSATGAAYVLAEKLFSKKLSDTLKLPSARRDVIEEGSDDASLETFNASALITRGWLDPSPLSTDKIFKDMVESMLLGDTTEASAILRAKGEIEELFNR